MKMGLKGQSEEAVLYGVGGYSVHEGDAEWQYEYFVYPRFTMIRLPGSDTNRLVVSPCSKSSVDFAHLQGPYKYQCWYIGD